MEDSSISPIGMGEVNTLLKKVLPSNSFQEFNFFLEIIVVSYARVEKGVYVFFLAKK